MANLRQDILEKRSVLEDKNAPDVAVDEKSIQPLIKFFKDKFRIRLVPISTTD